MFLCFVLCSFFFLWFSIVFGCFYRNRYHMFDHVCLTPTQAHRDPDSRQTLLIAGIPAMSQNQVRTVGERNRTIIGIQKLTCTITLRSFSDIIETSMYKADFSTRFKRCVYLCFRHSLSKPKTTQNLKLPRCKSHLEIEAFLFCPFFLAQV